MDNKVVIKEFLKKVSRKNDFEDDEDIMSTGIINSLFAMQLVLFLEKKFEISIGNEDLDVDNFRSLNSISNYIDSKLSCLKGE